MKIPLGVVLALMASPAFAMNAKDACARALALFADPKPRFAFQGPRAQKVLSAFRELESDGWGRVREIRDPESGEAVYRFESNAVNTYGTPSLSYFLSKADVEANAEISEEARRLIESDLRDLRQLGRASDKPTEWWNQEYRIDPKVFTKSSRAVTDAVLELGRRSPPATWADVVETLTKLTGPGEAITFEAADLAGELARITEKHAKGHMSGPLEAWLNRARQQMTGQYILHNNATPSGRVTLNNYEAIKGRALSRRDLQRVQEALTAGGSHYVP